MRNIVVSALAAISLAMLSTPASAETRSVSVQYDDLDLTTPAGISTLESRIAAAAKRICGKAEVRDVHDGVDHRRCLRETEASVTIEIARLTGKRPILAFSARR